MAYIAAQRSVQVSMALEIDGRADPIPAVADDGPARWLLAAVPVWAVAGVIYSFAAGARAFSGFASIASGVILSAILGALVATIQLAFLQAVRLFAGRWLLAAAGGALGASVISLLISRVPGFVFHPGDSPLLLVFRLLLHAALASGSVAFVQRWSMQGRVRVPFWFAPVCILASCAAAFGLLLVAISALKSLR